MTFGHVDLVGDVLPIALVGAVPILFGVSILWRYRTRVQR